MAFYRRTFKNQKAFKMCSYGFFTVKCQDHGNRWKNISGQTSSMSPFQNISLRVSSSSDSPCIPCSQEDVD